MTTKERVHRLCVRLAKPRAAWHCAQCRRNGEQEIAAAFEPTVERLVEALQLCVEWDESYREVNNLGPKRPALFQGAFEILAELERE